MGKIKRYIMFLLFFATATSCFAKQITIQIVQHNNSTDSVSESSLVVEDELLDGFFNNGFIVTNIPAVVSKSTGQDDKLYTTGIGDAWEGSSDYFVQIKLFYENGKNEESKSELSKIDWVIASASTGVKIGENSLKNMSSSELEDLKMMSSSLIKEIKKAIKA